MYLTEASEDVCNEIDITKQPNLVKQRTKNWYKIRQGAIITGITAYRGVGL